MNRPLGTILCLTLAAAATAAVFAAADLKVSTTNAQADLKVGTTMVHDSATTVRSAGLQASSATVRSAGLKASRFARFQASQAPLAAQTSIQASAVLSKYCITCHNEKRKTAGLMIDHLDLQQVGNDAEIWEKVARKFRTHEMPPPGAPRPDAATYAAVTADLENALDTAAIKSRNAANVFSCSTSC